ncbi:aminotransferase class III-fold pyridoxal phosphate-dependent enzyme [Acinetobacter sp. ANC 5378]|uniref:aspartate aminotransferase family protein n=1 Tax=Acinetobacter sp. ANC 5378 TaxID=2731249 RepID=UPI00148FA9E8|nr:aminotransferase class III-fold pyridoxal phosphate-dependent enzyme [Acinetobacter sp. ANC 5378]NNG81440.1 aminotransferase class III-fold pyridoxal phosphate-dependent enzyme [Acinetobacter sp. ANC 5378]
MNSSVHQINNSLLMRRKRVMGQSPLFYQQPLHLVKGEGVYLYDADGKTYLDCYNNIPVVGHCNPHVVQAIYEQAQILNVHSRYLSDNIVSYGERLLATFKAGFDQIIFTCSGSEANDQALRIVRQVTEAQGIICSNYAYHGNTAAVDCVSPLFKAAQDRQNYDDVQMIPFPETYRPLNGLSGEALINAYLEQVQVQIDAFKKSGVGFAGIIFCSLFANEGLPDVPATLLQKVTDLVHAEGGLVIADEVQAGFGRTGLMWGHEYMGFVPDIATMGKPMGNGYPIAALVAHAELFERFRQKNFYFNTFAGAQVAAAAANAVLDVFEEQQLLKNASEVGDYIRTGLRHYANKYNLIDDVRGVGLWIGFEMVSDKHLKTPAILETKQLVNNLKEQGILVSTMGPYDNVLKIRPPLIFNQSNADELLEKLSYCLSQIK